MVNGLYTASKGMSNILARQDIHAHNLANANTTGFKLSRMVNRVEIAVGRNDKNQLHQDEKQEIADVYVSFRQGPMVRTGNRFDLALETKGFFTIEGENGNVYTRNGSFALNASGELVTLAGKRVLDENNAPISMKAEINLKGDQIQVMQDGGIFLDGNKIAMLGLADFPDMHKMRTAGDGLFSNSDPDGNPLRKPESIDVRQGFLEGSNVSPIETMASMLMEFRNYEADQKALHAINDTLGKAVNEVGRV